MNKKRAQGLSLNYIIVAAIGLLVFIIIAIIFRVHVSHYSEGYKKTADKAIESAQGIRCEVIYAVGTRKCSDGPPQDGKEWKAIPRQKDKWTDCKPNEECYELVAQTQPTEQKTS